MIKKYWKKYNPSKKRKILIAVDDIIAHMMSNKRLTSIVSQLFIRGRKLNIFLVFAISTNWFLVKIPNKPELPQIALNYSSDIDFKNFMNPYKNVF